MGRSTSLAATLDALAEGPRSLTAIATAIRAQSGPTVTYLERLGDVVERTADGHYQLADTTFALWLRWRRPGGPVVPMRVVGDEAEKAVAELLAGMGFDLVYQSRASRGAFDLLATRGPAQLGVQVKRATLPWRCPRAEWSRMAAEGRRFHWHWIVAAVGEREEIALLDPAKAVLRKEATLRENARIANLPLWLDTREVLPVTREAVRRRD